MAHRTLFVPSRFWQSHMSDEICHALFVHCDELNIPDSALHLQNKPHPHCNGRPKQLQTVMELCKLP